jgi:AcrR family transcriptional regulator
VTNDRGKDRRVQKTEALLHGALAALIHEKSYDAIAVKEILARANVGRSTFYSHFRDKGELLESGIREVLLAGETTSATRPTGLADRLVRFSLPILEHIERYRVAHGSAVGAQGQAVVHEHLERVLVQLVADDLRRASRCRQEGGHTVPCELLARHLASTFLLVVEWWLQSVELLPAKKANDLFRALALPAVTEVLD